MSFKSKVYAVLAVFGVLAGVPAESWSTGLARNDIKKLVIQEAEATDVPPALALAVAKVESDFSAKAVSSAGARGVMQIMPKTAKDEFGIDPDELWNPKLNVRLGIDFLSRLYHQYGQRWELALSHYNGGTLKGKGEDAKPHGYTRKYIRAVLDWRKRYEDQAAIWRVADAAPAETKSDGWSPARTQVKESIRKELKSYRKKTTSSVDQPEEPKGMLSDGWGDDDVRSSSKRPSRRGGSRWGQRSGVTDGWDDDRSRIGDDRGWRSFRGFGQSFEDRLRRAREELDDFGPGRSRRRG